MTTADQNKVGTSFDNENNGDETVGAVGVVGDGSASQTLDGYGSAANGAAGVPGTGRPMTEEEMIAEAIRRGEETAEAEIAADAQRAAQERDRLQNELDSVSDQICRTSWTRSLTRLRQQSSRQLRQMIASCACRLTGITTVVVPLRSVLMSASAQQRSW